MKKPEEKRIWEKPLIQNLSVKKVTQGGNSPNVGEQTEPPYHYGWQWAAS